MNDILRDALKRHGIERQVTAARIVKRANELLEMALDNHVRKDVKIISFIQEELFAACRHPAALRQANRSTVDLKAQLEVDFPEQTIRRIVCRLDPDSWDPTSYPS
ncbi:hypothetical protein IH979_01485 [Patescibacteria group bacterium]|nr:hypothetical protein [Patescibacteria group bacterium]